ncbi:MAG TPA: LysR substrate-binding domain-containing protein [Arenibaculum sp.]|nr:LysR substrate-binding domain-containing protein [Arenibaculum sp.]
MQDLNDLYFFAQVVDHGGFAAAGRALGIPKSKLSRRIAQLEERLGVRLIQRSSRRFAVTGIGRIYHRHCLAMVAEAGAAQEAIDRTRAEPQGTVRISCPVSLAQSRLAGIVSRFLTDHPRVRIHVEATNRRVDVIDEGFDIAIRVRRPPLEDSDLVVKVLARDAAASVASPRLLDRVGRPREPGDLVHFDSLAMTVPGDEHAWRFTGPDGAVLTVPHRPRLVTDEMMTLRQAALDGIGIVQLPELVVGDDIARGTLEPILTRWAPPGGLIHAVFASRRGLVPAVRRFIDALASSFVAPDAGSNTVTNGR